MTSSHRNTRFSFFGILFLIGILTKTIIANQIFEQVAGQTLKFFSAGREANHTIRQCSCEEQTECVEKLKIQGVICFHECWDFVKPITDTPDELKECFEEKEYIIEQFATCLEDDLHSCVETKNGPLIVYTDLNKVIMASEKRVQSQANKFLRTLNHDGKILVTTALNVTQCIKNCFVEKNKNGYCFDEVECQPNIEENAAKQAMKTCSKEIGWKKEASELCDCALKAGVERVKPYCQLLHTISKN